MGLFDSAREAATGATGGKVVTTVAGTAYGFSSFPLSTIVSIGTLVLTAFYIWSALPRVWRTAVALKRGLVNKDWSMWKELGKQPAVAKED
ncbi:hypothetical protein [Robbsia andropogonis]|uniref:hypothetical protein n=1 Tax=Robbsia andropogonis TaxID=28092 RepID=UPI002A6B505E|nr:hypothetical protein [Robbsia andropogonis]